MFFDKKSETIRSAEIELFLRIYSIEKSSKNIFWNICVIAQLANKNGMKKTDTATLIVVIFC